MGFREHTTRGILLFRCSWRLITIHCLVSTASTGFLDINCSTLFAWSLAFQLLLSGHLLASLWEIKANLGVQGAYWRLMGIFGEFFFLVDNRICLQRSPKIAEGFCSMYDNYLLCEFLS